MEFNNSDFIKKKAKHYEFPAYYFNLKTETWTKSVRIIEQNPGVSGRNSRTSPGNVQVWVIYQGLRIFDNNYLQSTVSKTHFNFPGAVFQRKHGRLENPKNSRNFRFLKLFGPAGAVLKSGIFSGLFRRL